MNMRSACFIITPSAISKFGAPGPNRMSIRSVVWIAAFTALFCGPCVFQVKAQQQVPVITWATPAPINAGTALSSTQLNATANVPGTFVYTPAAGAIPAAGTDALSVVFTPNDTINYGTAVTTTSLLVNGPAPIITTVAGNGTQSYSGDNGPAISAGLFGPVGIAFDSAGNYYIADGYNNRVRKVNVATGIITTVAGNGIYGYAGDSGPATSAEVAPTDVVVDSAGNLYISDGFSSTIRKVDASTGIITTIAGNGTAGYSGDGGPATSAELNVPRALTLDASGNVYIADSNNNVVRELNVSTGIITTIAGTSAAGDTGDGGPATAAEFYAPRGIAFGPSGNLYVSEWLGSRVRKIDKTTGIITTVAGGGPAGYIGDGGPATSANLKWSLAITFDAAGNLYICDENNYRVRKVNSSTGIITTVAGNGINDYSGDGGPASSAAIHSPTALAFDSHGNLYVVDSGNRIREVILTALVTWATPAPIIYGTALGGAQLNATANVPGAFSYNPAVGTVPHVGNQPLSVTFTPFDTTDYSTATASVVLNVTQATPVLTWPTPAAINYGTPLSDTQLNATASVAGNFNYSPAVGAVLPPGDQVLSVTLIPNDTIDYQTVSETVPLTVNNSGGGTGQTAYSYLLNYQPNSNIHSYNDSVMGTWSFSYDSLNRLAGAQANQPGNSFTNYCWSYDAFGNRTSQEMATSAFQSGAGGESPCLPANPAPITYNTNNQINGGPVLASYDTAGDMTYDGKNQYLYNADGQICAVESYDSQLHVTVMTGYIYDAEGNRVAKGTILTMSCDPSVNGFTPTADYVRDQAGNQLSEFAPGQGGTMIWQHTNVYANGVLIATEDNTEAHFYLNDWLGTRRVQTDYQGMVEQTCSSLPYGDSETCLPTPTENLFTGKERDAESGLDYFGARYYGSSMGRFMSPDPLLNSGRPDNPQTWNRYAYAFNNPLRIIDPTGLYNLDSGCLQNKKCAGYAKKLRNGVADLTKAVNGMKAGAEKDRLQAALKAFGTQNDGNNVGVTFAPLAGSAAGHTDPIADANGNGIVGYKVTFDPSKNSDSDGYAINAAHESTHITNMEDPRYNSLGDFSDEYRAYESSAWAAAALWQYHGAQGTGTFTLNGNNGSAMIWNSSWGAVDDKVLTQFITHNYQYSNGQPYKETTPHDPWAVQK